MVAIFGTYFSYKASRDSSKTTSQPVVSTEISLESGAHLFHIDIYTPASGRNHSHTLLFLRKHDGALRAWYLPLIDKQPALPSDNGIDPVALCEPFEILAESERIECTVKDVPNRNLIVHGWSWDGEASGPLTSDLRAVTGQEKDGRFVFADTWLSSAKK